MGYYIYIVEVKQLRIAKDNQLKRLFGVVWSKIQASFICEITFDASFCVMTDTGFETSVITMLIPKI